MSKAAAVIFSLVLMVNAAAMYWSELHLGNSDYSLKAKLFRLQAGWNFEASHKPYRVKRLFRVAEETWLINQVCPAYYECDQMRKTMFDKIELLGWKVKIVRK